VVSTWIGNFIENGIQLFTVINPARVNLLTKAKKIVPILPFVVLILHMVGIIGVRVIYSSADPSSYLPLAIGANINAI
jgi:hypothetical protein